MTEIEDRLRDAQTRRSAVVARRARDEVEVENATKAVADAKAALKEEFGVVTSDELKDKRAELEAELETQVADLEKALEAAGG